MGVAAFLTYDWQSSFRFSNDDGSITWVPSSKWSFVLHQLRLRCAWRYWICFQQCISFFFCSSNVIVVAQMIHIISSELTRLISILVCFGSGTFYFLSDGLLFSNDCCSFTKASIGGAGDVRINILGISPLICQSQRSLQATLLLFLL